MRKDKIFNSIIGEIVEETGLELKLVNKIIEQQFKSVKKVIESNEPIVVKLPYLGKFNTSKKWYEKVKTLKLQKKNLVPIDEEIIIYN